MRSSSALSTCLSLALTAAFGCETSGSGVTAQAPQAAPRTAAQPGTPLPGQPLPLPAKLIEGRFFVTPMTEDGHTITLFTDTGGGLFLSAEAANRLGLPIDAIEVDGKNVDSVLLPTFAWDAWIPPPAVLGGRMPVAAEEQTAKFLVRLEADGMLGQGWFKERVWTFDYPDGQLWLRAAGDLPKHDATHRVPLGFQRAEDGVRTAHYPRITVKVDGEPLELLFDTGATVMLTDAALAALADQRPAVRGTSFITRSVFERWVAKHPDWRVIENADRGAGGEAMIEVPAIEVAGYSVGPVWFTRRADKNFHEWMSQWMDTKIEGALGSSALAYFRVTVDYPRALAVFERP